MQTGIDRHKDREQRAGTEDISYSLLSGFYWFVGLLWFGSVRFGLVRFGLVWFRFLPLYKKNF